MHQNPGPGQLPAPHFSGDTPLPVPMHQPTMSSSQMIQEARGVVREPRSLSLTPTPTRLLPSFVGPDGAHIPSSPDAFSSPDLPLFNPELVDEPEALSLVEQGLIQRSGASAEPSDFVTTIRRNSRGERKRLQPRTSPRRRIASSRRQSDDEPLRRFSSLRNKVRGLIEGLSEQGIDDELIEIMGEHIAEEDNHVPSSFSSLTESQENPPVQTSQLGLRRLS